MNMTPITNTSTVGIAPMPDGAEMIRGVLHVPTSYRWKKSTPEGHCLMTRREIDDRLAEAKEAKEEIAKTQWRRSRQKAYVELGRIEDQFDELVKGIAEAKNLNDIKKIGVVTRRMAIKSRFPKQREQ